MTADGVMNQSLLEWKTISSIRYRSLQLGESVSTRGAFGFRINGQDKITFSRFDSYPGGLGDDIVIWLKSKLKKPKLLAIAGDAYMSNRPDAGHKIMCEIL